MNQFAKLFEVKEHQVLITLKYSEETEEDFLKVETQIGGVTASIQLEGFKTEASAKDGLEKYNQEKAEEFFDAMNQLLTNNDEEE